MVCIYGVHVPSKIMTVNLVDEWSCNLLDKPQENYVNIYAYTLYTMHIHRIYTFINNIYVAWCTIILVHEFLCKYRTELVCPQELRMEYSQLDPR